MFVYMQTGYEKMGKYFWSDMYTPFRSVSFIYIL